MRWSTLHWPRLSKAVTSRSPWPYGWCSPIQQPFAPSLCWLFPGRQPAEPQHVCSSTQRSTHMLGLDRAAHFATALRARSSSTPSSASGASSGAKDNYTHEITWGGTGMHKGVVSVYETDRTTRAL